MNLMRQAPQATSQGRIQCDPLTMLSLPSVLQTNLRAYVSSVIWDARVRRRAWLYVCADVRTIRMSEQEQEQVEEEQQEEEGEQ